MKMRLFVTSLLIGMVTVAPTWLSLQPAWSPEQRAPRPSQCPPGPHRVDFAAFPVPEDANGQFETPLSTNGCLRLREERRSSRRLRWQVLELEPEGRERNFTRLAWFGPGEQVERVFDSSRREVVEVRTTDAGVQRRVVVLPAENLEQNRRSAPRRRVVDHSRAPDSFAVNVATTRPPVGVALVLSSVSA